MPDEPIQSPADKQQPKKVDLPIAGKIVDVKGKDGLDAKKEGNEIKLSFELPTQANVVPEITPETSSETTGNITPTNQSAADTEPTSSSVNEARPENTSEQQSNPTDNNPPAALPPTTPGTPTDTTNKTTPSTDAPTAASSADASPSTSPTTKDENKPIDEKPLSPHEQTAQKKGEDWDKIKNQLNEEKKNGSSGSKEPNANKDQPDKPGEPTDNTPPPTDKQPPIEGTPETPTNQPSTPTTLTPEQQRTAGQDLKKQSLQQRANNLKNSASSVTKNPKQTAKNLGTKLGDNIKTSTKAKGKTIANSLRTSGMRRRKLLKEADEISKQISELQETMRGLKASRELRILKFFFPSLYNKIAGISETTGDISQKIKVNKLESQVTTLRTAKISLETAQGAAAVLDAIMTTVRLAAGLIETVIGTIAVILLSPIIVLVLAMIYFVVGGKFSQAIKDLVIKINKILEPLEKTLGVEKKKLNLMEQRKEKREEIKNIEAEEKQEKQQAQQTGQKNQTADRTLPTPTNTHTPSSATTPSATPEDEESEQYQLAA